MEAQLDRISLKTFNDAQYVKQGMSVLACIHENEDNDHLNIYAKGKCLAILDNGENILVEFMSGEV